jgi:hypothetical protein
MDCYLGIDVAKATLDIAALPSGETWAGTNDDAGLHELVPRRCWRSHRPSSCSTRRAGLKVLR